MNLKDQKNNTQNMKYPQTELRLLVTKEPETTFETQANVSFEEEFNRAIATAIPGNELRKRMYDRIQTWPWKEKSFIQKI